jgi:hypothetical protein
MDLPAQLGLYWQQAYLTLTLAKLICAPKLLLLTLFKRANITRFVSSRY